MFRGFARVAAVAGACAFSVSGALADCNLNQFKGFYVGAHGGFATYTANQTDANDFVSHLWAFTGDPGKSYTATENGVVGGAQVGYNFRPSCTTLFGVEADWSWANLEATSEISFLFGPTFASSLTSTLNGFGSIRTRTGVVADNLLFYVTGGIAFADIDFKARAFESTTPIERILSFSDMRIGWTAGVGTEWALWKNVSLKSEVLYMHFGEKDMAGTASGIAWNFSTIDSMWVSRVGLNFKF